MTTPIQKQRCCEILPSPHTVRGRQCRKVGYIERDGKFYCRLHDPVNVKAKNEAKIAKWELEAAERIAKFKAEEKRRKLFEESGIAELSDEQIEQIIRLGGIMKILEGIK